MKRHAVRIGAKRSDGKIVIFSSNRAAAARRRTRQSHRWRPKSNSCFAVMALGSLLAARVAIVFDLLWVRRRLEVFVSRFAEAFERYCSDATPNEHLTFSRDGATTLSLGSAEFAREKSLPMANLGALLRRPKADC